MATPAPSVADARRATTGGEAAVVATDDLLAMRIRDALGTDGIEVGDRAQHVADLSARAASAGAIVLAGTKTAADLRAALRAATERFPGVPIVVVASLTRAAVGKAVDAGACGVVLETNVESALPETVRAVRAHQVVVPGRLHRGVVRPPLSHREKEALALVASGLTNREIAAQLFLAESTVKTHLASIFAKLGVGSRSEAAALVLDPDEKLGVSIRALAAVAGAADQT